MSSFFYWSRHLAMARWTLIVTHKATPSKSGSHALHPTRRLDVPALVPAAHHPRQTNVSRNAESKVREFGVMSIRVCVCCFCVFRSRLLGIPVLPSGFCLGQRRREQPTSENYFANRSCIFLCRWDTSADKVKPKTFRDQLAPGVRVMVNPAKDCMTGMTSIVLMFMRTGHVATQNTLCEIKSKEI